MVTTYKVYRNGSLIASPSAPPFTDTGLTNGQLYSYQVSAVNEVGEGPKAGPVLATPVAPPAPGNDPQWVLDLRAHWDNVSIVSTSSAPTSIPHDGVTGSSAALNAWLSSVPSGTSATQYRRIDLTTIGGTLVLDDEGINIRNKSFIQLYMPGMTIRQTASGNTSMQSVLLGEGSSRDIWVYGGGTCVIDSENPYTGTANAKLGIDETRHSLHVRSGAQYVNVDGVRWLRQRGFGPWTSSDGGGVNPSNIWVHGCYVEGAEMGLAFVGGRKLLFEDIDIVNAARIAMDAEPDLAQHVIEDLYIRDIRVNGWGWDSTFSSWFFAAVPGGTAESVTMTRITVKDCTSINGPASSNGNQPNIGGLAVRVDDPNNKVDFTFINNSTTKRHSRTDSVMRFRNVNNLTVTGNTQGLNSGSLVSDVAPLGTHIIAPNNTA